MLAAAIGSVVCGTLMWIVVELDPPSTIGVCQTAIVPVLAARAPPANASIAPIAAAASAVRVALFICNVPFVSCCQIVWPAEAHDVLSGLPRTFQKPRW